MALGDPLTRRVWSEPGQRPRDGREPEVPRFFEKALGSNRAVAL